jgi:hypothetical protein
MTSRRPDILKAPEGISLKVPSMRAGELSYEETPSAAFSRQESVGRKARRIDRITTYYAGNMTAAG